MMMQSLSGAWCGELRKELWVDVQEAKAELHELAILIDSRFDAVLIEVVQKQRLQPSVLTVETCAV